MEKEFINYSEEGEDVLLKSILSQETIFSKFVKGIALRANKGPNIIEPLEIQNLRWMAQRERRYQTFTLIRVNR